MIAEVILNSNAKQLNRVFDYEIPQDLASKVKIGSRVFVPFGNRKALDEGFVVNMKQSSSYEVKPIKEVDETEYIYADHIKLAKWMAKRYFCNVSDCIKLMLTPGTRTKNKEKRTQDKTINSIYLKKDIEEIEFDIETKKIKSDKHKKILYFVKDNEGVTIPEIEMFTDSSRAIVNTLIKNRLLRNGRTKNRKKSFAFKRYRNH